MRRWFMLLVILSTSCGPSQRGLFGEKKSAHEKYGDRLKEAGFDKTRPGIRWFNEAQRSLTNPLSISLPYKETGYFAADEQRAAGYVFDAKQGSYLNISVTCVPSDSITLFTELWQPGDEGKIRLVAAADSTLKVNYEVEKDGRYVVRLQPRLLEAMEYTLTITTSPSLAFPVSEIGMPKLISFWRDPRDRGARSHEGIDISAKFRTPVVAAADGLVHRVTDNRLGGKVVFMRPKNKNFTLYYAHLDTQTVSAGQTVKAGQTLGLVGTTGNAKGSVPHLHFGIYAIGGAVDPLPYIDPRITEPPIINAPTVNLGKWQRSSSSLNVSAGPFAKANTLAKIDRNAAVKLLSATGSYYKVLLPDGQEGFVSSKSVTDGFVTTKNIDTLTRLLDRPVLTAASKTTLPPQSKVHIVGTFGDFYLAEHQSIMGWIKK